MATESSIPFVLVDTPDATEIFASFIAGVAPNGPGVVSMTFASARADHANATNANIVNLRLIMPTAKVKEMVDFLAGYLAGGQQAPIQLPPGETLQ